MSWLIFSQDTSRFAMVLLKFFCQEVKTDVYSESNYVYIAKLESKYCPVTILRKYIEGANLDLSSHFAFIEAINEEQVGL